MDKELTDFFNEYCESQLLLRGVAKSVSHFDETDELNIRTYYCAFDGDGYSCHICLTDDGFICHELSWDGSDYEHDISEVFLLFDIDDFKDYSYDNCIVESRIKSAVDETVGMLFTYAPDIKRAGEGDNYDKLLTGLNNSPSNKGPSLRRVLKNGRLHDKMVKTRSDKDREKYIADLELWEQKGWLSDYGKRELKRLKQGFIDEEYDSSNDWEKVYTRFFFLAVFVFALISFAVCFGIQWLSRAVFLNDGLFIFGNMARGCTAATAVILTIILSYLFASPFTVRFVPEQFSEFEGEFKKKADEEFHKGKIEKILVRAALVLAAVIALPLLMSMGTANYAFFDDHFDSHFFFSNTSVAYSDCRVYLVQGEYDKYDEFEEYRYPYYYIEYDADGETYTEDIGLIKNAEKQQQLKSIFDNNNISIKTLKNIEE